MSPVLSMEQGDFCLTLLHKKADLAGTEPNSK